MPMNKNKGFTLVELLVYLGAMVIILLALSYMMINAYSLYDATLSGARADRSASTLMQVLASELRSGATIDQASSVFNTAQGQLTITAKSGGNEMAKVFRLENNRVILSHDGVDTMMSPEDMEVTKFLFTQIVTPISYAVRYEVDLTFPVRGELVTRTYPGVVILRHSYE